MHKIANQMDSPPLFPKREFCVFSSLRFLDRLFFSLIYQILIVKPLVEVLSQIASDNQNGRAKFVTR